MRAARSALRFGIVASVAGLVFSGCGCQQDPAPAPPIAPSPNSDPPVGPPVTEDPPPAPGVTMLYAWSSPFVEVGGVRLADHTWVTEYDGVSACPPTAGYYYCWGSCHKTSETGVFQLVKQTANFKFARCICQPDDEHYRFEVGSPSHGGIDFYGIHGVCHQLSNRILYAATSPGTPPPTVAGAYGYGVSRFVYGVYGTDAAEWASRVSGCTGDASNMAAMSRMTPAADLTEVLKEQIRADPQQVKAAKIQSIQARLLEVKQGLNTQVQNGRMPGREFAERVNRLVVAALEDAERELDPEEYQAVFGIRRGEPIGLIDPDIAARLIVRR